MLILKEISYESRLSDVQSESDVFLTISDYRLGGCLYTKRG